MLSSSAAAASSFDGTGPLLLLVKVGLVKERRLEVEKVG
jgi:hypothetical protein